MVAVYCGYKIFNEKKKLYKIKFRLPKTNELLSHNTIPENALLYLLLSDESIVKYKLRWITRYHKPNKFVVFTVFRCERKSKQHFVSIGEQPADNLYGL